MSGAAKPRFGDAAAVGRDLLTTPQLAHALDIDDSPSAFVRIDSRRLDVMASHIRSRPDLADAGPAGWDDPTFWNVEGTPEERSQYFTLGNAINFRFWRIDEGKVLPAAGVIGGQEFRGSMYMWRRLRQALEAGDYPILDASFLAGLTEAQFDRIFADDSGINPLNPGREERINNLRDLGIRLERAWEGRFFNLLRATDGSLVEFTALSSQFRAFDDPLHKLTMVNAILHSGSGVYRFRDDVIPGIDYQLLKQLMRQGVLVPSRPIANKLSNERLLNDEESYEVRRMALVALVRISSKTGLSGQILDNRYWLNRTNCTDLGPVCEDPARETQCPFLSACARLSHLGRPLEMTRYY